MRLEETAVLMRFEMLLWPAAGTGEKAPANPTKRVVKERISRESDVPRIDKSCVPKSLGQSGNGKAKHNGNAGAAPHL
jgi:hypothetical protein